MRTVQVKGKICLLLLVLLVSFALTSCDMFSAAKNLPAIQTAPASPTPALTQRPVETSTKPILDRELSKYPYSLISDRLSIRMPVGTQDIARQQDIMGAQKSSRGETRLVLDGNGQQMVVYAKEAFYLVDDLQAQADDIMKLWYGDSFAYRPEPVRQSGDGLTLLEFTPEQIDTSSEAVLIRGVLARTNEGALIVIGVYVTPQTFTDKEACLKLAGDVLGAIQPGTRKLELSAHEEFIDYAFDDAYRIMLDNGYALIPETGPDFTVYYIQRVTKIGESAPSIGIYIGAYPSPMYQQRGIEDSMLAKVKDTILNNKVEWLAYQPNPDKENYSAEAVFGLPNGMKMHIFVDAANEAEFQTIKQMIHSLKRK